MKNKENLELAEWIISAAKKKGADDVKVVISSNREIDIKYRDRKLENLKESVSNSLSLNIYAKNRFSGHSTSDLRKLELDKFIEEAVSATKYLSEDIYRKLPDPKFYPEETDVNLEVADRAYDNIDSAARKKIAEEIEDVTLARSDKIISAECSYYDSYNESVQVHSNGFRGERITTYFGAGSSVTVNDKNGGRPEDYYWAGGRFFNDLPSPEFIGTEAATRALGKIGQEKIETGKYDILVENRAGGRLLGMLSGPMTARALQQKASFLDGKLGQKIASDKLTLIDDPFIKKGLGSSLFDGDGVASRKKIVIEKGVLNHYYVDNYYGRKLGMDPNCGSPTNILFEYGEKDLQMMIKEMNKGILINGFLGGNSNGTTGDFSFGLVGLLIENGKIEKPVNELNISGNAKEFWNTLVEVGNDAYPYSSWKIPTFKFSQADISGL